MSVRSSATIANEPDFGTTNFADLLAETLSADAASAELRRDPDQAVGYSAIREKVGERVCVCGGVGCAQKEC